MFKQFYSSYMSYTNISKELFQNLLVNILLAVTKLKLIRLDSTVICRSLGFSGSTWEKRWSVLWGWNRQGVTARWCDPEDSEPAGKRTLLLHIEMMYHDPFLGMTVSSSLKQRKADEHYTGLGGCSSWQRPEQSRWRQQVRRAKLQQFVLQCFPFLSVYYWIFCFVWLSMWLDNQVTHSICSFLSWFFFPLFPAKWHIHRSNMSCKLKTDQWSISDQ